MTNDWRVSVGTGQQGFLNANHKAAHRAAQHTDDLINVRGAEQRLWSHSGLAWFNKYHAEDVEDFEESGAKVNRYYRLSISLTQGIEKKKGQKHSKLLEFNSKKKKREGAQTGVSWLSLEVLPLNECCCCCWLG